MNNYYYTENLKYKISIEDIKNIIQEEPYLENENYVRFSCPNCGHKTACNLDKNLYIYNCFHCNDSGGIIKFLSKKIKKDKNEIIKILFKDNFKKQDIKQDKKLIKYVENVIKKEIPEQQNILNELKELYKEVGQTDYFEKRNINKETVKDFKLFYNKKENKIIIPIRDIDGNYVGIVKRFVGDPPQGYGKYMFNKGFKKGLNIYGLYESLNKDFTVYEDTIVLVEGQFDLLNLVSANKCAYHYGAIMGSSITDEQIILLLKSNIKKVKLMFDNDIAGKKAKWIAIKKMFFLFDLEIVNYPEKYKDPGEIPQDEILKYIENNCIPVDKRFYDVSDKNIEKCIKIMTEKK